MFGRIGNVDGWSPAGFVGLVSVVFWSDNVMVGYASRGQIVVQATG